MKLVHLQYHNRRFREVHLDLLTQPLLLESRNSQFTLFIQIKIKFCSMEKEIDSKVSFVVDCWTSGTLYQGLTKERTV